LKKIIKACKKDGKKADKENKRKPEKWAKIREQVMNSKAKSSSGGHEKPPLLNEKSLLLAPSSPEPKGMLTR
jgi:hypothetical protein